MAQAEHNYVHINENWRQRLAKEKHAAQVCCLQRQCHPSAPCRPYQRSLPCSCMHKPTQRLCI